MYIKNHKGDDMAARLEKNEARQAERKGWQEKVLYASLAGSALVLAIAAIVFIA
jgi:cell division protein FtsL